MNRMAFCVIFCEKGLKSSFHMPPHGGGIADKMGNIS